MPADEFADWQAYFQVEPWGTHAMETIMAQVCQAVIATSGNRPPDMAELMPFVSYRNKILGPRKLTGEELYHKAMAGIGGNIRITSNGG